MNYRKLGKYGLRVSDVSLGGWLTHGRTLKDETTSEIVARAIDLGVNFFDTADVYNQGEAEKSLAVALRGRTRERSVIATKCFFPMSDDPNDRGLSRKHIFESVHASLRRLQTDYVDLFQFHRFDPEVPLEETVHAVSDLVRQGKVLYWGTSEWPAAEIASVAAVARELGATLPVSNQPCYNMLVRGIEKSVLPTCQKLGMGQVVFSPLAQGVLTGKYLPGKSAPAGSRGADESSNMFMREVLTDERLQRVQSLRAVAEANGVTMAQLALAWCLRQPGVSSVIVGATSIAQLEENAKATDVLLGTEVWEAAERALEGPA